MAPSPVQARHAKAMRAVGAAGVRDNRGVTAIEYALICSLVIIAMIGGLSMLGGGAGGMWTRVHDAVVNI